MLDKQKIDAVKESWRLARGSRRDFARDFYDRLFERAPGVRSLFPEEMSDQRRKLTDMLETLVRGLTNVNVVILELSELGRRHADYDTAPEHYPVVGEVLIATLKDRLGERFTGEHELAWEETLELVSTVMIDAQQSAGGEPPLAPSAGVVQ